MSEATASEATASETTVSGYFGQCHAYVANGLIYGLEDGLLVVVVDSPVAVYDGDALLFRRSTIAHVHAVVRTVVPTTRILKQLLCKDRRIRIRRHLGSSHKDRPI